ncbi:hypothetical protein Cgig2_007534 [Carnegiea gigantea]|uniref:Tobamovirus multiplication protein 2A n=1 Tax=Carnegiea gigantea TaxID=171969 RepID=A0A9Q1JN25_9CARY|nr:hypothetical protein Cgig2_007534 [Carnegiea gigantea]
MACRGFWECLLKLLNFLMTLAGLAIVGYGIYLFVMYKKGSSDSPIAPVSAEETLIQLGRPLLLSVPLSNNIWDHLPKAWFIYLFVGVGVVVFLISCCGCIGASTRNGCCLTTNSYSTRGRKYLLSRYVIGLITVVFLDQVQYAVFIVLLILVELGCAAFIFFDKDWDDEIPTDKTGNFDMIYDFLKHHWDIARWILLGIVVLEALLFLLAVIVRAVNGPADYDSDEEFINHRQSVKQPLISRQAPATVVPVVSALDQRPPGRNDAWSARMREKYGLDTSEFTYNPNDPSRYQQPAAQPTEERGRCTIM